MMMMMIKRMCITLSSTLQIVAINKKQKTNSMPNLNEIKKLTLIIEMMNEK